jgi:MYXO-CTERM domain-containing protein
VDYNLQPSSKTSLAPGESLQLTIWAEELSYDAKGKCLSTKSIILASPKQTWTVICPDADAAGAIVTVSGPDSGYASKATLHFSVLGGSVQNPKFFCSLNGAAFEPCNSPEFYSGLKAGEQVFRVYVQNADGTPGAVSEHRWEVYAPGVVFTQVPSDSTDTSAVVWFEASPGVDVPVAFKCSVDGGSFFDCASPLFLSDLEVGEHSIEVYATSSVGTGEISKYTWQVLEASKKKDSPKDGKDSKDLSDLDQQLRSLQEGCSVATGMPLSLLALAGLWMARRRRS